MKSPLILAGAGLLSGLLVMPVIEVVEATLAIRLWLDRPALGLVPGVVFGGIFGAALWHLRLLTAARWLAFAAASGLAYYLAYRLAVHTLAFLDARPHLLGRGVLWAAGVLAGAVGAGLLTVIMSVWLPALRRAWAMAAVVATGAASGTLLDVFARLDPGGGVVFFTLWQGSYATALAWALTSGRK